MFQDGKNPQPVARDQADEARENALRGSGVFVK